MPRSTWENLDAQRRERVLHAAMAEFGRHGYSGGSLNVIAREAGVAKGSLFQYFDDKFDLFAHVAEQTSLRIYAVMAPYLRAAGDGESFVDHFTGLVDVWIGYMATHPLERGVTAATTMELDPQVRTRGARTGAPALRAGPAAAAAGAASMPASCARDADLDALVSLLVLRPAASGPGPVRARPGRRARAARHRRAGPARARPGASSTPCWQEYWHDRTTTS